MKYQIKHVVSNADIEAIKKLWRSNFPHDPSPRLQWLYGSLPGERGHCWLALTENGEAIGSVGLLYRDVYVNGSRTRCGQAVDLVVNAAHRTAGVAVMLLRRLTSEADSAGCTVVYTFPMPQSRQVALRVGFKPIGILKKLVMPLATKRKLHSAWPNLLASIVSATLDASICVQRAFLRNLLMSGTHADYLSNFDDRFNKLWTDGSVGKQYIGSRRSEYLAWRFFGCPKSEYRVLALQDVNQELTAYIVFHVQKKNAVVSDYLAINLRALMAVFLELGTRMSREGNDALTVVSLNSKLERVALKISGLYARPEISEVMLRPKAALVPSQGCLEWFNGERWFITEADRDV